MSSSSFGRHLGFVFLLKSGNVRLNMLQVNTSRSVPEQQPKCKGNYTGERLKMLRPETYRRVVELLAEPREHVSFREICRQCHVTDDTVKAVEKREAIPIAARKQALMGAPKRKPLKTAERWNGCDCRT
jgi:hypothetical protein